MVILKGRAAATTSKSYGFPSSETQTTTTTKVKDSAGPTPVRGRSSRVPEPTAGGRGGRGRGGRGNSSTSEPVPGVMKYDPRNPPTVPVVPKGSAPQDEYGSGSTKRTAFRKARKGIRDAWDAEDDSYLARLGVLARLQVRWGLDSKNALGPLKDDLGNIEAEYNLVLEELRKSSAEDID